MLFIYMNVRVFQMSICQRPNTYILQYVCERALDGHFLKIQTPLQVGSKNFPLWIYVFVTLMIYELMVSLQFTWKGLMRQAILLVPPADL
jgi:uncharacterized membrane protein